MSEIGPSQKERLQRIRLPGRGVFAAAAAVPAGILGALLERLLAAHERTRDPSRILKRNLGTLVTCQEMDPDLRAAWPEGPRRFVVKEAPIPAARRALYRVGLTSPFGRELERHADIARSGVRAPRPWIAAVRPAGPTEHLISEFLEGGVPLRDLLWKGDRVLREGEALADLLRGVGIWLRALHDRGVWQRDMKPSNVLWRAAAASGLLDVADGLAKASESFWMVDMTSVRLLGRPLEEDRRVRNLSQILDLPSRLDGIAREPLLLAYLGGRRDLLAEWSRKVALAIETRRERRLRQCGCRHVDEEHAASARAAGQLP